MVESAVDLEKLQTQAQLVDNDAAKEIHRLLHPAVTLPVNTLETLQNKASLVTAAQYESIHRGQDPSGI